MTAEPEGSSRPADRDVSAAPSPEPAMRQLIRSMPTAVAMTDTSMCYVEVNERWRNDYGLGDQPLIGRSHYDVFPNLPERWKEIHRRVLEGASERCDDDSFVREDGRTEWLRWDVSQWRHMDGKVGGLVMATEVVTEKKLAHDALRSSEERFRSAMESSPIGMAIVALDGRFEDVNPALCKSLGYAREELLATDFQSVTHPDDLDTDLAFLNELLAGHRTEFSMRKRYLHAMGRNIEVQLHVSLARHADGSPWHFISQILDVSEQVAAEQALKDSEEKLRLIADNVREVFWLSNVDKSRTLYVSPGYDRIWGEPASRLEDEPLGWLERVHADDRQRVSAALKLQPVGGYDEEYRIVRPDGELRWIHDRAFPIPGPDGNVTRIVGIAEDITERRRIEVQLLHSQRMEAVGQLAGGVAHDFNNMLAIILMHASFAKDADDLPDELRESIDDIEDAAQRAATLTRQLLQLGRKGVLHSQRIDLNDVIMGLSHIMERTLGESLTIRTSLAKEPLEVVADPSMLEQVLMNLVINARDAMPHGGRLVIETGLRDVAVEDGPIVPDLAPGRFVWLRVSDNGVGIAPENIGAIFEPFFTTKGGKGTGLGLASIYGIVKQHRGTITVYSTLGIGSTFQVFLPVADMPARKVAPAPTASASQGGGETILLVEDDAIVRKVTRQALEKAGYRVLTANNGREALEVYASSKERVELLLTDLVMPLGLSGRDLAARLQSLDRRLAVILTSGYSPDIFGTSLELDPYQVFLVKPVPRQELLEAVRVCLDRRAAES